MLVGDKCNFKKWFEDGAEVALALAMTTRAFSY